jgi:hypothetical protein
MSGAVLEAPARVSGFDDFAVMGQAIVKLGGPRAFMRGHLLRMFEQPAVLEIDRDADRAEGKAAAPVRPPIFL